MTTIFAGNWKMHHGPTAAARLVSSFLAAYTDHAEREVWFFAPAVSVAAVAGVVDNRAGVRVGIQNIHWAPKGALTGETSVAMARDAGATATLVGHSERRHVFGETDEETGKKVRAALDGGLAPMLCVGELLEERERGETLDVVQRQLRVLEGLDGASLAHIPIAYEPVWAIGTGKNATPADAAEVHAAIRTLLLGMGASADAIRVLYGGSVKPANANALIGEREIDGVLVGGASLELASWQQIVSAIAD